MRSRCIRRAALSSPRDSILFSTTTTTIASDQIHCYGCYKFVRREKAGKRNALVFCLVTAKGFVELPAAYFLWSVPYEPSQCSNPHVVCASAHMVRAKAIYFRTRRNIFQVFPSHVDSNPRAVIRPGHSLQNQRVSGIRLQYRSNSSRAVLPILSCPGTRRCGMHFLAQFFLVTQGCPLDSLCTTISCIRPHSHCLCAAARPRQPGGPPARCLLDSPVHRPWRRGETGPGTS